MDVFQYFAGTEGDPDDGVELTRFLSENEILTPANFAPEYLALFEEVSKNPLLRGFEAALELKRSRKASNAAAAAAKEGGVGGGVGGAEGGSGGAASATAGDDDGGAKKRPGRPKGVRTGEGTKRPRKKSAASVVTSSAAADSVASECFAIHPVGMSDLVVDPAVLENSTAVFTFCTDTPVRLETCRSSRWRDQACAGTFLNNRPRHLWMQRSC